MRKDSKDFLVRLLDEPAPSGFEAPAQRIWRKYVEPFADRVETDVYGNHTAILPGSGAHSVMIVGHCDEIGLIVKRFDESGTLRFGTIGGIDSVVLPGTHVRILTKQGEVPGVIGWPAVHLMPRDERKKRPKWTEMTVDIGAADARAARRLVSVGDPMIFGEGFRELAGGYAAHRAFDNRMGCWIVAETLRGLARSRKRKATVYGVSSVQEETGVWGAGLVADQYLPTLAIAVDVTHDTTTPNISKTDYEDVRCGAGPVLTLGVRSNRKVCDLLQKAARTAKVPLQIEIDEGRTGTDADPISARRTGVPIANISVACRYMHTPTEVIHLRDLEQSVALLVEFVSSLPGRFDPAPQ